MIELMTRWKRSRPGFTIVELLVVVVVVAILAAITIVAYNGVQRSARESAIKADLRQAKAYVETQKIDTSSFPSVATSFPKSEDTVYQYRSYTSGYCLTGYQSNTGPFHVSGVSSRIENGPCLGHEYGYPTPAGTDTAFPMEYWTPSNGSSISGSVGTLAVGSASNPRLRMPLIRVDGAVSASVSWQVRPVVTGGRFQWSTGYFAANGTTPVDNTMGYSQNGHAPSIPPDGVWTSQSTTFFLGPDIVYMRIDAVTNLVYAGPVEIRNVTVTLNR